MKCLPSKALDLFQDPKAVLLPVTDIPIRNVEEGLDYLPWWRSYLSNLYHREYQRLSNSGQAFSLPTEENDQLLIDHFMFKTFGVCNDSRMTKAMRWCERNHKNSVKNMAKIRAMLVAGCSDTEIAAKFFTCPEYIAIYAKLFFDIRPCLDSSLWMDTFIRPEIPNLINNDVELEEMIWLSFGYNKGPALLDVIMSGRIAYLSIDESDEFWQIARSVVTAQGLMHALGNLMDNICGRSTEWERSLALRDSENKKLLNQDALPNTSSWSGWMNEAIDSGIFTKDIEAGIKNGEKAFIDIISRSERQTQENHRAGFVASRSSVVKQLPFNRARNVL